MLKKEKWAILDELFKEAITQYDGIKAYDTLHMFDFVDKTYKK